MITAEELEKLAKLKDKGIITEDEFNAKKDEFLKQYNFNSNEDEVDDEDVDDEDVENEDEVDDEDEENTWSLDRFDRYDYIKIIAAIILFIYALDIHPFRWLSNIFNNNPCISQIAASAPHGYRNEYTKKICSNSKMKVYAIKGEVNNAFNEWMPAGFLCHIDAKSNEAHIFPAGIYSPAFVNADESLCE